MLREEQTVNQAGLSPHDMHCHQYLGMVAATHCRYTVRRLPRTRWTITEMTARISST